MRGISLTDSKTVPDAFRVRSLLLFGFYAQYIDLVIVLGAGGGDVGDQGVDLHIRQSGKPRSACYVFEGFMDYLSFLTLRLESCPQSPDFDRQDYIVLNSVANVPKALYPLGSYERIHCFFDNDRAGMEAIQQIRKEYDATRYIRDASQIYSGCKDLNEYLQKRIADRKEQAQSVEKRNDTLSKKPKGFRL